jgi:CRISPR-associated protein Cmr6
MRKALSEVLDEVRREKQGPHHAGLAHERWAPLKAVDSTPEEGKKAQRAWNEWLEWLETSQEPDGYAVAFNRWKDALCDSPTLCFQTTAVSRLLVGHGNPAPTGVGLTLHHTWGVPVLPGTALKGLLSAYVRTIFGPLPGAPFRRLFGTPAEQRTGEGAARGELIFHDALWVSQQGLGVPKRGDSPPRMLARDVLTVHQKSWYAGQDWPSDHDDPNPVAFLTVRPGSRFLVALSLVPGAGAEATELLRWAGQRLREALAEWGLGGKTAAGYGRFESEAPHPPRRTRPVRRSEDFIRFQTWLAGQKDARTPQRDLIGFLDSEWRERLLSLTRTERQECQRLLRSINVRNPELKARMQELLIRLDNEN